MIIEYNKALKIESQYTLNTEAEISPDKNANESSSLTYTHTYISYVHTHTHTHKTVYAIN